MKEARDLLLVVYWIVVYVYVQYIFSKYFKGITCKTRRGYAVGGIS